MFKDYMFILVAKGIELVDENDIEEEVIMNLNSLSLIFPLNLVEFDEEDETEIMGNTLIAFIDELEKSFNIINLI